MIVLTTICLQFWHEFEQSAVDLNTKKRKSLLFSLGVERNARNVKQLQEIRLNEDLLIENLKETLTPMSHYGRNNIWLTDIIP